MANKVKEMDSYPYRNRKPLTHEENVKGDRIIMALWILAVLAIVIIDSINL